MTGVLAGFADQVARAEPQRRRLRMLLDDPALALRFGRAARARVQDECLGDRHLRQYVDLFDTIVTAG